MSEQQSYEGYKHTDGNKRAEPIGNGGSTAKERLDHAQHEGQGEVPTKQYATKFKPGDRFPLDKNDKSGWWR